MLQLWEQTQAENTKLRLELSGVKNENETLKHQLGSAAQQVSQINAVTDAEKREKQIVLKKLAEMEIVNLEQIKSMSANTLLRIFTETDFDEMKRMYCYTCLLMPGECEEKFQSFGNESKAKKEMRQHLEEHVNCLITQGREDFTAEPVLARKRRLKDVVGFVVLRD